MHLGLVQNFIIESPRVSGFDFQFHNYIWYYSSAGKGKYVKLAFCDFQICLDQLYTMSMLSVILQIKTEVIK